MCITVQRCVVRTAVVSVSDVFRITAIYLVFSAWRLCVSVSQALSTYVSKSYSEPRDSALSTAATIPVSCTLTIPRIRDQCTAWRAYLLPSSFCLPRTHGQAELTWVVILNTYTISPGARRSPNAQVVYSHLAVTGITCCDSIHTLLCR